MSKIFKYKDYCGRIEFSNEDNCFCGRIIGIEDLVSFEGNNEKELKKAFEDSVDEYLEILENKENCI